MATEAKMRPKLTAAQVVEDYEDFKQRQSRNRSMATSNWVTTLAHDCEAYAIYNRIVPPEQRRQTDARLAMIFAEGSDQGLRVKRDLLDMGYEVLGDEGQMVWQQFEISGRKDFAIRKNGSTAIRVEVKSCSPWIFERVNTVGDLRSHKSDWVRKWDRQICLYMVLQGASTYWLLLKSKTLGAIKIIEYTLGDEELQIAEEMIGKAERVNQQVRLNTAPATTKLAEPEICAECEFLTVCNPPLTFGPGAKVIDEAMAAEFSAKAERWAELKPGAAEFADLDEELKDEIKALAGDSDDVVFGEWMARLNRIETKKGTQVRVSIIKCANKSTTN